MKHILIVSLLFLLAACAPGTATPTQPVPPPSMPPVTDTPSFAAPSPTVPPSVTAAAPTGTASADAAFLPNPALTPGAVVPALNPSVTPATIGQTICVSGWTATVRPPATYTDALKVSQIAAYRYADTSTADYEEDHLVPLELGGAPKDPANLWPQPRNTTPYNAGLKDTLENVLKVKVCSGALALADAQNAIAHDWVAAYRQYVGQALYYATAVPTQP